MTTMTTRRSTAVRDIPRSCSCRWSYHHHPAGHELTEPDPACIWHNYRADAAARGIRIPRPDEPVPEPVGADRDPEGYEDD